MSLYDSPVLRGNMDIMKLLSGMQRPGGQSAPQSPMGDPAQAMQSTDFPMLMEQIRTGNQVQMSPDILSRLGLMGG